MTMGYAFIDFTDTSFAILLYWVLQQVQFPGVLTASAVQGLESNIAHAATYYTADECFESSWHVVDDPEPSPRAVNSANTLLSPQCRQQFHKTKLCTFFKKKRCEMGSHCPFAHSQEELMPAPDLAKTKLCYSFFCNNCNDSQCKFAHGYQELRAATQAMGSIDYCPSEFMQWYNYGCAEAGDYPVMQFPWVASEGPNHDDGYEVPRSCDDDVQNRPCCQHLEAAGLGNEDFSLSIRRSWSEGDLDALRLSMEEPDSQDYF